MASEIIERLIQIDASQGAASMRELYTVVQDAKDSIKELDKESDAYQKGLVDLKTAQNKYAEATRIAVANNENAKGSFNDLNGQLRILKEQWKKTADEAERSALTEKINAVKDQINGMNESIGNFQHNVGNYASHWKGLEDTFKGTKELLDANAKGFTSASNGVDLLAKTSKAFASGNPLLMLLTALIPLFQKVVEGLKQNKQFTDALAEAMAALNPVTDLLEKVVTALANALSKAVTGITNLLKKVKILKNDTAETAPVMEETATAIDNVGAAAKSATDQVDELANALARIREQLAEEKEVEQADAALWADAAKEWAAQEKAKTDAREAEAKRQADIEKERVKVEKAVAAVEKQQQEEAAKAYAEAMAARKKAVEDLITTSVDAASALANTFADIMESNAGASEKQLKAAKAMRIASATIDTIEGATAAFMACQRSYPQPYGAIIGATQAAIVTAAGMANVAKIKAVDTSGKASAAAVSSPTATAGTGAATTAPAVISQAQTTRYITGASQETRADQVAKAVSQPVVLVWSEAEAMAKYGQSRRVETTFK